MWQSGWRDFIEGQFLHHRKAGIQTYPRNQTDWNAIKVTAGTVINKFSVFVKIVF
jgi:hypothetical protein